MDDGPIRLALIIIKTNPNHRNLDDKVDFGVGITVRCPDLQSSALTWDYSKHFSARSAPISDGARSISVAGFGPDQILSKTQSKLG